MHEHIDEWRKLNLQFRGICTGFLGSAEQISIVRDFIDEFGGDDCITLVDRVMGDEGKAYGTYTPEMCERMAELVAHADIITPNITEACILANVDYDPHMSFDDAFSLAQKLCDMGPSKVVVTGGRTRIKHVECMLRTREGAFHRNRREARRAAFGDGRRFLGNHRSRCRKRSSVQGVNRKSNEVCP